MTSFPALERTSRRPLDAIASLKVRDNRDFLVRGTLLSRRPWTVINPPIATVSTESRVDFVSPLVALLRSFAFTFRRRLLSTSSSRLVENSDEISLFLKNCDCSRTYCPAQVLENIQSRCHSWRSRTKVFAVASGTVTESLCHCNLWPRSARCNPVLELFIHSNARVFEPVNIAGG